MDFRLLGTVEVVDGSVPIKLPRRIRRELIAAAAELGDKRFQEDQQHALDTDPRDPANRG